MRLKAIAASLLVVLVTVAATFVMALGGCVTAQLADLSRKLDMGMTESQVKAIAGSEPHSVSLETCGSQTPQPWTCKRYLYKSGLHSLYVNFQRVGDAWVVNNWNYYD